MDKHTRYLLQLTLIAFVIVMVALIWTVATV